MIRNLLFLIIFSGLILPSCRKEDCSGIKNSTGLIARMRTSDKVTIEYSYLCSGLLSEIRTQYTNTKYFYDPRDLLVRTESYIDFNHYANSSGYSGYSPYVGYEYNYEVTEWTDPKKMKLSSTALYEYNDNNQLLYGNFKYGSDTIKVKVIFNLNSRGLISKEIIYRQNEKPEGYIDFLYDEIGNLIKSSYYSINTTGSENLYLTLEYKFDSMHNPFFAFKKLMNPGIYTNPNNIIMETKTLYGEIPVGADQVEIINHTFNYNELGYPIKKDDVFTFEYF